MKIISKIVCMGLSFFVMGHVIAEPTIGLGKQLYQHVRKDSLVNQYNGVLSKLHASSVFTIQDFEMSVYRWLENMHDMDFDSFTAWLRLIGYVKGFLKLLELYGDQLDNRSEIIFNTDAVKWNSYTTFHSDDEEKFNSHVFAIINSIEETCKNKK